MSEIITFILDNYKQLRPVDWFLIVVLVLFLATLIFIILRWLFKGRFEAQKGLLEIKDSTIGALRERLNVLHEENELSKCEVEQTNSMLTEWRTRASNAEDALEHRRKLTKDFLGFSTNAAFAILIQQYFLALYRRLEIVRDFFNLYTSMDIDKRLPRTTSRLEIEKMLKAIAFRLRKTDEAFNNLTGFFNKGTTDPSVRVNINEVLSEFKPKEISQLLDQVINLIVEPLDHIELLTKKTLGSTRQITGES